MTDICIEIFSFRIFMLHQLSTNKQTNKKLVLPLNTKSIKRVNVCERESLTMCMCFWPFQFVGICAYSLEVSGSPWWINYFLFIFISVAVDQKWMHWLILLFKKRNYFGVFLPMQSHLPVLLPSFVACISQLLNFYVDRSYDRLQSTKTVEEICRVYRDPNCSKNVYIGHPIRFVRYGCHSVLMHSSRFWIQLRFILPKD